jgi:hypothetical protein
LEFGLEQPLGMKDRRFQAPSRSDFDPLDEVYDGLNIVEFETNNKGDIRCGFLFELKNAHSPSNIEKFGF